MLSRAKRTATELAGIFGVKQVAISRGMRILMNTASVVLLAWIGYVIYGSFTNTGIWRTVDNVLDDPAGSFAACLLIGAIPLAGVSWLIWRLGVRGRAPEDFPSARLRSRAHQD